jgi:hypothetical protein
MLELAEMVLKKVGGPSKVTHLPLPGDDPKQRRPDISLAEADLGWKPKVALEDGLDPTIEYFRMLRSADVECFPRFGLMLAVAYCGIAYFHFIKGGKDIPPVLDAVAVFIAVTGAFTLQLRYSIKGIEALLAVAANLLGFLYIAYLFGVLYSFGCVD